MGERERKKRVSASKKERERENALAVAFVGNGEEESVKREGRKGLYFILSARIYMKICLFLFVFLSQFFLFVDNYSIDFFFVM